MTAGPAVTVTSGGSLTLRGANGVVLKNGFSVASGASFSAGTDPDLDGSTWSFAYQDTTYFLTSANGPWGSLAWSYDRIGNRLSETRDGWTDTYVYTTNGSGGRTPILSSITLAAGGTRDFAHGPAGHLTQVSSSGNVINFTADAEGRLTQAERLGNMTAFSYDGRSHLNQAGSETDTTGASLPVYSSAGILHTLTQRVIPSDPGETHHVFYFAGRSVAQLSTDSGTETWRYLTTDHLGTPWVATDTTGAELWHGPFEPFGRDRWAGTNLAASAEDVFLRLPGQWDDEAWLEATRGAEVYYNLHRWYRTGDANYSRPDPLGLPAPEDWDDDYLNPYSYAARNPVLFADPTGLVTLLPENDLSPRCRRRWLKKILPRLQTLGGSRDCSDFFCRELGTDLQELINGTLPLIVSPRGLGGYFRCHRNVPQDIPTTFDIEPFAITVRKGSLCGRTRDALQSIIHELGHFADCWNNGDRFEDEEDGCGAEFACFGHSIGDNCKDFVPR
jgi:RHS repeat-associated protein